MTAITYSQPQLSFRMTKPVIYHSGGSPGTDYYRFDLEVMASATSTYLWSGQAQFTFNNTTLGTTLSNWIFFNGTILNGTNELGHPMYSSSWSITGTGPYEIYCNWFGDNTARQAFGGNDLDFNEVPTTWTQLGYIRAKITSNTGMAGIDMHESVFNGNESYLPSGDVTITPYANPNAFDIRDFMTTYVQRIYNGTDGWTGCGVSTSTPLAKASLSTLAHWTINANTSVWDTTSAAAVITVAGSLANALRIHLGASLKINADANLKCSGNTEINNPKGLWIVSNLTSTGSFIDNGITYPSGSGGTALVERYLDPGKWHGYCVPFTSTSVIPYRGVYMKYWTESNRNYHYIIVPTPGDSTLNDPCRGYMAWDPLSNGVPNNKVYPVGSLNTGSISSIAATRTSSSGTGNGYNLLGNPYPSGLDLGSTYISWNQLDHKAWVWNNGNYAVYINSGGGDHTQYIPPQQGFFVHVNTSYTGSTTLDVTNNARVHTTEAFLKDNYPDLLFLKAASGLNEKYDITSVIFNSQATQDYDDVFDAGKLAGDNDAPQLYSIITNWNLTVNAIPWTGISQVVPLGFSCGVSGNYTITASNLQSFRQGTDIYLKDLKLNQTQSLNQDSVYSFSYQTGESASRFQLLFSNPYYGVPSQDAGSIRVYAFDEDVYVRFIDQTDIHGTLTIFDQIGRKVFTGKLENKPVNQFHPGLLQGYYVVMVQTDQSLINKKIYLK